MSVISIRRDHHLPPEQIRQEVETLAEQLADKLGAEYHWEEDTLKFSRKQASGHIDIGERDVSIEVRLGMMLRPLKGTLEKLVSQYLDEHLG